MSSPEGHPDVVLVTDPRRGIARTIAVVTEAGRHLGPGRLIVQLRDKESVDDVVLLHARSLREATRAVGALLVVNVRLGRSVEVARLCGADGVHVPDASAADVARVRSALGGGAFVSAAAHDDEAVTRALEAGVTAVLVSPIFEARGPGKAAPRGALAITRARAIVDAARRAPPLLIYALGGIDAANAARCRAAGADGVAAIRAFYDDPRTILARPSHDPGMTHR